MKNSLPIVFIILAIGMFYVYLSPQYSTIQSLRGERTNYDDILDKSVELRELREELRDKLQGFSSTDLDRLEKMLPQKIDPTQLVLDLDNIARRYGIVMEDMSTEIEGEEVGSRNEDVKPSKPFQTLSLSFNFGTSYQNFIAFMKDVESSLRIMDVSSVSINVSEEEPRSPEFEVKINSYWLR